MTTNSVYKFMSLKLRDAFLTGIIISIIIFIFGGKDNTIMYYFGLLLGIANFFLLAVGMDFILSMRPIRARIAHVVLFTFRYLAIAIAIVLVILHNNANVFVVVGGLLTMNFSLVLAEAIKHLFLRKEG